MAVRAPRGAAVRTRPAHQVRRVEVLPSRVARKSGARALVTNDGYGVRETLLAYVRANLFRSLRAHHSLKYIVKAANLLWQTYLGRSAGAGAHFPQLNLDNASRAPSEEREYQAAQTSGHCYAGVLDWYSLSQTALFRLIF